MAQVRLMMQTLAYLLPVLSKAIQSAEKEFVALQQQGKAHEAGTLQALVVVPSRELAMQIVRVAQGLLPHDARATIQQCIGGANPNRQVHLVYMPHHPSLPKGLKVSATYACAAVGASMSWSGCTQHLINFLQGQLCCS